MAFLITLLTSTDPTWDTYGTSIASGWETALAIVTACIPGLKTLLDKVFPKIIPSTKAGTTEYAADPFEMKSGTRIKGGRDRGFEELGPKHDEDHDSTTEIKVNYEYSVRSV